MPHTRHTFRASLLFLAGLTLAVSPLMATLGARQGGGQSEPVLHDPANPLLKGFSWRSIGPVGQGARIDDLAVVESNPSTFYIGYAVSGVWKTTNNATTFTPIFDAYGHNIGDIAIAPSDPNTLYVGTGEPNNRQSSSYGDGVYKSTDAGATFSFVGLRDTQSIARIVVHPTNPNTVWVAAVGHLFGPNADRGVFKSTDGGATWTKTLFMDENTGATDLVIDPSNPNTLFAATYERRRSAWGFVSGGANSGIHRSTDGGSTWQRVTGNGLPTGLMGRIGLDFSRSNPDVIYAQIETGVPPSEVPQDQDAPDPAAGRGGGGGGGRGGGGGTPDPSRSGLWRSNDKGRTWAFVSNENNRPMYYSQVRVDPNDENVVYVGGQNAAKSVDGGKTFQSIQGGMGHVDNHAIWIDPANSQHVLYGNDGGLEISWDGGDTFESVRLTGTALPYHVSVDMRRPYWVCTGLQDNGSWCGPSTTRTGGIHMWNWISVGGGDGFQTQVDPTDPNVFFTESQNGNINRYDLNTGTTSNVRPNAGGGGRGGGRGGTPNIVPAPPDGTEISYNWNSPIRISPHNPRKILFGGNRLFVSLDRGDTWRMSQRLGKGIDVSERSLMGKQYSLPGCGGRLGGGGRGGGRGAAAPAGPPATDCVLSRGDGVNDNEFGTLIEVAESPVVPGVIWAGTNDGNVQVSRDDGHTFTEVSRNIPGGLNEYQVSGLEASRFDAASAYVSLDGHMANDMRPHVFKTSDYGATWQNITNNLPVFGHVNSIRQDLVNPRLLFATTEMGFYVSLNDGQSWDQFMPNLPKGRLDEVVIHPREGDLVLASHGRGIQIMDDITPLQQLTPEVMQQEAVLFTPREAVLWARDIKNSTEVPGSKWWAGDVAPRGTAISYYLRNAAAGDVLITITNQASGEAVRTCLGTGQQGMNRFQWTLTGDPGQGGGGGRGGGGRGGAAQPAPAAPTGPQSCEGGGGGGRGRGGFGGFGGGGGGGIGPGAYKVTLSIGGREVGSKMFNLLEDSWLNEK